MDFLEYLDEVYEELVDEFGHEIESKCVHEQTTHYSCSISVSRYHYPAANSCDQRHKRKRIIVGVSP